jgi:hypothetical protein
MVRPFSLDELLAMGWTLEPSRGVSRPGLVSLALVLRSDGVRRAQLGGVAPCYDAALADAVAEANRWLQRNGWADQRIGTPGPASDASDTVGPNGRHDTPLRQRTSAYPGVGVRATVTARTTCLRPRIKPVSHS